ncbi:hypothetical protein BDQ17DRAFT_1544780 [Cyathus striatus]|nr:hypothetical protein BDQ17DRAFT_1544780 [Cyathus striatus]
MNEKPFPDGRSFADEIYSHRHDDVQGLAKDYLSFVLEFKHSSDEYADRERTRIEYIREQAFKQAEYKCPITNFVDYRHYDMFKLTTQSQQSDCPPTKGRTRCFYFLNPSVETTSSSVFAKVMKATGNDELLEFVTKFGVHHFENVLFLEDSLCSMFENLEMYLRPVMPEPSIGAIYREWTPSLMIMNFKRDAEPKLRFMFILLHSLVAGAYINSGALEREKRKFLNENGLRKRPIQPPLFKGGVGENGEPLIPLFASEKTVKKYFGDKNRIREIFGSSVVIVDIGGEECDSENEAEDEISSQELDSDVDEQELQWIAAKSAEIAAKSEMSRISS